LKDRLFLCYDLNSNENSGFAGFVT